MRFISKKQIVLLFIFILIFAAGALVTFYILKNNGANTSPKLDDIADSLIPNPSVITVKSVNYSQNSVVSGTVTNIDNSNEIAPISMQDWSKKNFDIYTATFELKAPNDSTYVNEKDTMVIQNSKYKMDIGWDSVGTPIPTIPVTNNSIVNIITEVGQSVSRGESNGSYYYFANLLTTDCNFQGATISAPCGTPSFFIPLQDNGTSGYTFGLTIKCTGEADICDAIVSSTKWIKSDPYKFAGNNPIVKLNYEGDRVLTWTVSGDASKYDTMRVIWSKSWNNFEENPNTVKGEFTTATAYKYAKISRVDGFGTYYAIVCLVNKELNDMCSYWSNQVTINLPDVGPLASDIDAKFNKDTGVVSWITDGYAEDGFVITFSNSEIPDSGFPAATYSQANISDPNKRTYTPDSTSLGYTYARVCAISYERGYLPKCKTISEQLNLTKSSEPFAKSINLSIDKVNKKFVWNIEGKSMAGFKIIGSFSPIPENGIPNASYTHKDVGSDVREYDYSSFSDYSYIRVCAKDQNVYGGWCWSNEAISNEVSF